MVEMAAEISQYRGNEEVFKERQKNTQKMIEELEGNNRELMSFIDRANYNVAQGYTEKVVSLLGRRRDGAAALRQPSISRSPVAPAGHGLAPAYSRSQSPAAFSPITKEQRESFLKNIGLGMKTIQ